MVMVLISIVVEDDVRSCVMWLVGRGLKMRPTVVHLIAHGVTPKPLQIHHIQRRDVVGLAAQMLLPETSSPELKAQCLLAGSAEWSVCVRLALMSG
jgi:hypothetical protein